MARSRKCPDEAAAQFPVGTQRLGNDGRLWTVTLGKHGLRWTYGRRRNRARANTNRASSPRARRPRPSHQALALEWVRLHPRGLMTLVRDDGLATVRAQLLSLVRTFRDGWEALTSRNQDLSEERLAEESDAQLRRHLSEYSSESMRALLAERLAQLLVRATRR